MRRQKTTVDLEQNIHAFFKALGNGRFADGVRRAYAIVYHLQRKGIDVRGDKPFTDDTPLIRLTLTQYKALAAIGQGDIGAGVDRAIEQYRLRSMDVDWEPRFDVQE